VCKYKRVFRKMQPLSAFFFGKRKSLKSRGREYRLYLPDNQIQVHNTRNPEIVPSSPLLFQNAKHSRRSCCSNSVLCSSCYRFPVFSSPFPPTRCEPIENREPENFKTTTVL
jgi:hypothetical protein